VWGKEHPEYFRNVYNLAELYRIMNHFAGAETLLREAVETTRRLHGEQDARFAQAAFNLAVLYQNMQKFPQAEALYQQVLAVRRKDPGEDHPDYAQALAYLAGLYEAMGNYQAADLRYRQVLALREKSPGEDSAEYGQAVHALASLYHKVGQLPAAEAGYQRAREIYEEALGTEHPTFAQCLHDLAVLYQAQGNYADAEPLFRRALDILAASQGEGHPEYIRFLHGFAQFHQAKGDYDEARKRFERVITAYRKQGGDSNPTLGAVLTDLAMMHLAAGDALAAEPLLRETEEIASRAFGAGHPIHVGCLHNLVVAYRSQGDFVQAAALAHKALSLVRGRENGDELDVANALTQVASVYQAMDDPARAEPPAREALEIRRRILGMAHPVTASSMKSVAALCLAAGRYDEAESLYNEALDAYRNSVGEDHPECIETLRLLAGAMQSRGDPAAAEPLLKQSTDIVRRLFGEESPFLGPPLTQLADCSRARGDHQAAEARYRQSLEIIRKAKAETGEEGGPPQVPGKLPFLDRALSMVLNNLALLYAALGRKGQAEPLLRQALEVDRQCLGAEHMDTLYNLAGVCAAAGREAEAMTLLEKVTATQDRLLPHVTALPNENAREQFLQSYYRCYQARLTLLVNHFGESPEAVRAGFGLVLRRKARWIDALAANASLESMEPAARELTLIRRQIANKLLNGPGFEGPATHEQLLAAWQERVAQLEKQLGRGEPSLELESLAKNLPADSALIEFARYSVFDFNPGLNDVPRPLPARYIAFVLRGAQPAAVKLMDLGEAETIDRLLSAARAGLLRGDDLGPARAFRERVFDRLAEAAGCRHLILSLDGELVHLPFAALPASGGGFLFDHFELDYVTTGRDLLRSEVTEQQIGTPLVAGAPELDLDEQHAQAPEPAAPGFWTRWKAALFPSKKPVVETKEPEEPGCIRFQLPAEAQDQVQRIARQLGVSPLLGRQVLKARLQSIHSPRILHLVAPGFFLTGVPNPLSAGASPRRDKLLLRSGLALTAANTVLNGGTPPDGSGDGLLTTRDVAGLDLAGTELAALPASGAGPMEFGSGPGVIALQRAFLLAGARAVLMTLWQLPVNVSQELFADFYRRLSAGQGKAESLRAAQRAIRDRYGSPLAWAGLVLCGET
jgi:tetratricopeptide (TPR) repeat protein/CHAT domain-containing protein